MNVTPAKPVKGEIKKCRVYDILWKLHSKGSCGGVGKSLGVRYIVSLANHPLNEQCDVGEVAVLFSRVAGLSLA